MAYLPWKSLKLQENKPETFSQIIKDILKTKLLDGQQDF